MGAEVPNGSWGGAELGRNAPSDRAIVELAGRQRGIVTTTQRGWLIPRFRVPSPLDGHNGLPLSPARTLTDLARVLTSDELDRVKEQAHILGLVIPGADRFPSARSRGP